MAKLGKADAASVSALTAKIGALQGIAAYAGSKVTHVKPHGALYNMASENEDYALAIGRGIKTVDPSLIYVLLSGSVMEKAAEKLGLAYAREGFVDRLYEDDGNLTSRKIEGAVIRDPGLAAERGVRMVLDGELTSRHGQKIKRRVDTLCVHGDEPTAVAVAKATREALIAAGVRVVPLPAAMANGKLIWLKDVDAQKGHARIRIPKDVYPGTYRLILDGGPGIRGTASDSFTIVGRRERAKPTKPSIPVPVGIKVTSQ